MKDLYKLKEQYEKLGQEIERLEKRPKGRFKPTYGERYWYVKAHAATRSLCWNNDDTDNGHYKMGSCYRTREEAVESRDRQLAYVELIDAIADYNDGWWPNWSDDKQYKYSLAIDHSRKDTDGLTVSTDYRIQMHDDCLYLKNRTDGLQNLIDRLGTDKIKLALGLKKN